MKIKLHYAPHIARKIALDIINSKMIKAKKGIEPLIKEAQDIIICDIKKEVGLENSVEEIIQENEEEIEFMRIDRKNLFWMIKKKLAKKHNFTISYEDRFAELSYSILNTYTKKDLVEYSISENMVRNIIYNSIETFLSIYEDIQDSVIEKMKNYKKKLIPGTQEYDVVFEKLYQEEFRRRGIG